MTVSHERLSPNYRESLVVGLLVAVLAYTGAEAQEKTSSRTVEVTWSELQQGFYPARSASTQNLMSLLDVDSIHYEMEILWGLNNTDFPENRIRDISGQIGFSQVPISSYSTLKVERSSGGYSFIISNKSYRLIARIDISDKGCRADVRYALNPGQMYFEMLSVAGENHLRISAITTSNVKCKIGDSQS